MNRVLDLINEAGHLLEDYFQLEPFWIIFIAIMALLVLIGSIAKVISDPFDGVRGRLPQPILSAIETLSRRLTIELDIDNSSSEMAFLPDKFKDALLEMNRSLLNWLRIMERVLRSHAHSVLNIIGGQKPERYNWRISGAAIVGIALLIFFYADLIQAMNNLSHSKTFAPALVEFLRRNPRLGALHISVVMSSIGTSIALALIYFETLHFTHFIPWEATVTDENGQKTVFSVRAQVRSLAFWLFWFNLFLITVMALQGLPKEMEDLPSQFIFSLNLVANIARILTPIPMIITSALLYWGLMIFPLTYALCIYLVIAILTLVKASVRFFSSMLEAFSPASKISFGIFLTFLGSMLIVFMQMIGTIISITEMATKFIVEFVTVMFTLLRAIIFLPLSFIGLAPSAAQLIQQTASDFSDGLRSILEGAFRQRNP